MITVTPALDPNVAAETPLSDIPAFAHITEPFTLCNEIYDIKDWVWVDEDTLKISSMTHATFNDDGEIPAGTQVRLFAPDNFKVHGPERPKTPFPRNTGFFATDVDFMVIKTLLTENQDLHAGDQLTDIGHACTWTYQILPRPHGHQDSTPVNMGLIVYDKTPIGPASNIPCLVLPPANEVQILITFQETVLGAPHSQIKFFGQLDGYMASRLA